MSTTIGKETYSQERIKQGLESVLFNPNTMGAIKNIMVDSMQEDYEDDYQGVYREELDSFAVSSNSMRHG